MYLPPSIDLGQSEKYILSIRIKKDGMMFSISDPQNGKNYCLREAAYALDATPLANIQRIIFELNYLTQQFKETNVVIVSDEYDIVPATYFDSKAKAKVYDFVHSKASSYLLSQAIDSQDCVVLYNIESDIYEFLSRNLCNPRFFHHSQLLIDFLGDKGTTVSMFSKMFVCFDNNFINILCYSNSRLVHSLCIEEDIAINQIYYILKTWEQCGYNQLKDKIYLCGKHEEKVLIDLQKYIKSVEVVGPAREVFLWNEEAQQAPVDLLSLSL